eukprot:g664.t1
MGSAFGCCNDTSSSIDDYGRLSYDYNVKNSRAGPSRFAVASSRNAAISSSNSTSFGLRERPVAFEDSNNVQTWRTSAADAWKKVSGTLFRKSIHTPLPPIPDDQFDDDTTNKISADFEKENRNPERRKKRSLKQFPTVPSQSKVSNRCGGVQGLKKFPTVPKSSSSSSTTTTFKKKKKSKRNAPPPPPARRRKQSGKKKKKNNNVAE